MLDTRYEAARHFIRERWPLTRNVTLLFAIPLVSYGVVFGLGSSLQSTAAGNALLLLLIAAGWWISEAMPAFAVSLFVIGFSVFFLDDFSPTVLSEDWEKYTATWSNPVIWILLGGFFLALGAQVTQLDHVFSIHVLKRFGTRPQLQLLAIMMITCIFSMFISNTSTTVMMFIVVGPLMQLLGVDPFRKAVALGIPLAASVGGMGTIIGSPPNAISAGTMEAAGIDFGFAEWLVIGSPLAVLLTWALWWLLIKRYPTTLTALPAATTQRSNSQVNPQQRWIVVSTFAVTILLWTSQPLHRLPIAAISFIPIVVFSVTGIVRTGDIKLLPWDTLILIAGGLTLGVAIHDSGLASIISQWIPSLKQTFLILLILGYLTSALSNIMSNTAATSVLIPIGISVLPGQVGEVALVVGLCASTALLLPISTPPNAIAFARGYLVQKDFRTTGLLVGLMGPPIVVTVVHLTFALI